MSERWNKEEVAVVIRARKILKQKGLPRDADVKAICEAAGVSRKTGYQWAEKLKPWDEAQRGDLTEELERLKAEHQELRARSRGSSF